MRFIHIADTHLGLAAFSRIDPETGMNLRERLIYDNFLDSIDTIIRMKPDALVHAGDLFDRVKPKTRAYTTVLEALQRLADAEIPFVVISGNHSMPKTRYTTSPFEVLEYHNAEVHAAYRYRYERVEIGDTVLHLVPNMLRPEDYLAAFHEIELVSAADNVMVTHGLASTLHDRRLRTVSEHELNATMLAEEFEYIALGHFHDQQQVADNAWYAGSPEYCSYGEIMDTKGALVVETGKRSVAHLDLPHTPMFNLGTIRCDGLPPGEIMEGINEAAEKIPGRLSHPMVQLTLTDIRREDARGLDRRMLAEVRSRVLDLRLRVIPVDRQTHVLDGGCDLATVDYVHEFEEYLKLQQLEERSHAFIAAKGREVLKRAIDRHQEEKDAAA
jgi:exonuclease SbcD